MYADGGRRAHFKKDLQPYVCISEDCSEPAVFFPSFSKWRKHMDDVHTIHWAQTIHSPQVWYCDVSPHEYLEFGKKEELEQHLRNKHSNDLNFKQIERRLARNVLPSPRKKNICPLCNQDVFKIYELQERLHSEARAAPPIVLGQKVRPLAGSRVRFQDVEDSSGDENNVEDLVDGPSLKTEEGIKLDLWKVSKHIAGHLKSLAFLSIRYLDHDAVTDEKDSGKAASGVDDADIEGSGRADRALERILDDFPEAIDNELEFEDIQFVKDNEEDIATASKLESKTSESLEEKRLQTQNVTSEQVLSIDEEKCLALFRLATDNKYEWYKNQVETRAEGTCEWFLHHENFKKWLQEDSGVLLVAADPGCGKSVLTRYLIDEALPRSSTICYFFFKDQDQNTLGQALCALLYQLFCYRPYLVRHAMLKYTKYGQNLVGSTPSLYEIFEKAGKDPVTVPLIIVLDAMDECAESDIVRLVGVLQYLSKRAEVKVLLTSRSHQIMDHKVSHFQEVFPNVPYIHLTGAHESDENREEIHYLIKHRIEQMATDRRLSKRTKQLLTKRLLETPHPTYLWVYLVFEYLKTTHLEDAPEEAATIIASLPKNVNEAYEQMLSKAKNRLIVLKALSIILAATRPLTLMEMSVAMNIDKQTNSISKVEVEEGKDLKSHFETLFGLFVSVRRGKISFLHHTAEAFLLGKPLSLATTPSEFNWKHSKAINHAHYVLAAVCVLYLNLFTDIKEKDIDNHAFLKYSAQMWCTHFHNADIGQDDFGMVPVALKICDPGSRAFSVWSQLFEAHYRRTPLLRAAQEGYEAVVRMLVNEGVDLEMRDVYNETPLLWAAEGGHVEIMRLLLIRGADIEAKDCNGQTPLLVAAENGHVATIQLLLDRGANIEQTDVWGYTPLQWAARYGYEKVVELLLDRGARIGKKSLSWAAAEGHTRVVRLLKARSA
ncbi:hypothetical protein F4679DRAFT_344417 [Xylaria curta]|nr:hypothetical protein F4679DRAFT_344417 [Xylaria curta]